MIRQTDTSQKSIVGEVGKIFQFIKRISIKDHSSNYFLDKNKSQSKDISNWLVLQKCSS